MSCWRLGTGGGSKERVEGMLCEGEECAHQRNTQTACLSWHGDTVVGGGGGNQRQ